ncbi:MAG: hypothetical protein EOL91_10375 [Actinobacteria bacterium]|nr:hypothetical protein [Actinomycetota bacterium]
MRLAGSARKHGVDDIDIQTAVTDHRLRIALDDDSPQRQLVLGFDDDREPIAIHAMAARKQYRDLLRERS